MNESLKKIWTESELWKELEAKGCRFAPAIFDLRNPPNIETVKEDIEKETLSAEKYIPVFLIETGERRRRVRLIKGFEGTFKDDSLSKFSGQVDMYSTGKPGSWNFPRLFVFGESFSVSKYAGSDWYRRVGDESDCIDKEKKNLLSRLLEKNHQLILTGAPGTGKTFMARRLAAEMIGCEVEELKNQEQFSFVQFHPGYDYSDFVIGLKPKLDESKQVVFEWKDGIFKTLCDGADKEKGSDDKKKFVMVIDEINRADLSRVFGELFFCLEEGYRGEEITLPNGGTFTIPNNVYIIGTMNDIDRSVESMDFALRRRFAWHEVKAEDTGEQIIRSAPKVGELDKNTALEKMRKVNDGLKELGFDEAYKLGGAYFKKIEKYASGPDNKWVSLWDNHIAVILREYLRGRRNADKDLQTLREAYDKAGAGSAPKNESEASIQQNNAGQ